MKRFLHRQFGLCGCVSVRPLADPRLNKRRSGFAGVGPLFVCIGEPPEAEAFDANVMSKKGLIN